MGVSKVIINNNVMIDLTQDTVVPEAMLLGTTAHAANGNVIIGTNTLLGYNLNDYVATYNGYNTPLSCAHLFDGDREFNEGVLISNRVTRCDGMFMSCANFNQSVTIPNSVTNCSHMFCDSRNFNSPVTIGNSVTDCNRMFYSCYYFNKSVTIPNSVTNCSFMFYGCRNFNQSVTIPNSVTDCSYMFGGCSNFNQTVYIPYTATNFAYMFSSCPVSNIYINSTGFGYNNCMGLVAYKNNSIRVNIYCSSTTALTNNESSYSIVGREITWTSMTNGYYNANFNIYIYSNYRGI